MTKGNLLKSHISKFSVIISKIRSIDVKIEGENQSLLLLVSLPPSYNKFRETMIVSGEIIDLEYIKTSLLNKKKLDT